MPLGPERMDGSPLAAAMARGALDGPLFVLYRKFMLDVLASLDAFQRREGIAGHVAEIGTYKGAFFVPLALCRREGEVAVAMDVFEDVAANWNPAGGATTLEVFRDALRDHLGGEERVARIHGDSLHLTPEAVMREAGGRFRLFSVDGSHSVHHTVSDIHLAGGVVAPGGVVFLDDVKNWGWPGVIEGFSRYMLLSDHHRLVPFWLLGNKLLLTTPSHHARYLEWAVAETHAMGRTKANGTYRISRFLGHDTVGF